ncbi:hypothetical protein PspLS_04487 [Pyricularia sp. CBS 133598]|nr:hypothetical protein PspLS_04487 [Pyricularia sp. CBS 133598]
MPPPPAPQNDLSLVPNISKTAISSGGTGSGTETSGIIRENGKEKATPQVSPSTKTAASHNVAWSLPTPPLKQRMASGFKSLFESAKKLATGDNGDANSGPAAPDSLFPKTAPAVDGEDCDHDCDSCTVKYPKNFSIDTEDVLYGHVKGWSTHLLVATGKTDWVRDVADEKGSVMQAVEVSDKPDNGRLMLSASNIPTPHQTNDYSEPTTVLLLPAFRVVENVTPATVPTLLSEFVAKSPTNETPLAAQPPIDLPRSVDVLNPDPSLPPPLRTLTSRPCPHSVVVLLCSQRTRDARCGQSAPLLRKELERHLRPLGLYRDLDDERPSGVGIYFISHVGGHKYSANMMIYRRPDPWGLDGVERNTVGDEGIQKLLESGKSKAASVVASGEGTDVGAGQCIWLARISPQHCENIVKYTILQGKVVKPETQLRGGFDRQKGIMSW